MQESSEPAIVISSSGMATGGRVLHHLERALPDERNTVLFVGYQAAGTRGRKLRDGARAVRMHGQDVPVAGARSRSLDSMSAHADANEILRWLGGFTRPPELTCLVHGEPGPMDALKARIEQELHWTRQDAGLAGADRPVSHSPQPMAHSRSSMNRQYLLEQIDDAAVVQAYADGFEALPLDQKLLIWHLYEAALAGRDIYYDQRYRHALEMRDSARADPAPSSGGRAGPEPRSPESGARRRCRDPPLHEALLDQFRARTTT